MRFKHWVVVILLFVGIACAKQKYTPTGVAVRTGLSIDAIVNSTMKVADNLYGQGLITPADYRKIVTTGLEITEIQLNELVPILREPDNQSKVNHIIARLIVLIPKLHETDSTEARVQLYKASKDLYAAINATLVEVK
jgi:hypothetical protein